MREHNMQNNMFTDQEEKALIKLVSENPALYDPRHKDYRSQYVRDQLWRNFGVRLHKTPEDCKKKWKCIRDAKNRYKKDSKFKHRPLKNSKDERHKLLSFISRSNSSPVRSESEEEDTMSSNPLSPHSDEKYFDSDELKLESAGSSHYREAREVAVKPEFIAGDSVKYIEETQMEAQMYRTQSDRRLLQDSNEGDLMKRVNESDETWQMFKSFLNKKEDDIDLFCRYIAQVLKSLPPMQRAEAKKQLGEIVCNYEIKAATAALDHPFI